MSTSTAMTEIRAIRDRNSKKHMNMIREERIKENEKVLAWLLANTNKTRDIVKY